MTLGLLLGIGRTFRRKRASSLDILSPKRAPRDFYKGQNCKPLGFHTRKGNLRRAIFKCPLDVNKTNESTEASKRRSQKKQVFNFEVFINF
ncbi:unnamed protein product [Arabidopsis thaliana]|uniref:Uncharacterized protein n=1 Tax=Arabidopsis thaliana TaxID=3702 RepID=A0A654FMH0_ARATH|nr:unnamed protein product [Arabidopsis thaliana]